MLRAFNRGGGEPAADPSGLYGQVDRRQLLQQTQTQTQTQTHGSRSREREGSDGGDVDGSHGALAIGECA
jgi:hypothetical protein